MLKAAIHLEHSHWCHWVIQLSREYGLFSKLLSAWQRVLWLITVKPDQIHVARYSETVSFQLCLVPSYFLWLGGLEWPFLSACVSPFHVDSSLEFTLPTVFLSQFHFTLIISFKKTKQKKQSLATFWKCDLMLMWINPLLRSSISSKSSATRGQDGIYTNYTKFTSQIQLFFIILKNNSAKGGRVTVNSEQNVQITEKLMVK